MHYDLSREQQAIRQAYPPIFAGFRLL